jgi:5'-AMP-activated protein kinase catalytic alpha subunit
VGNYVLGRDLGKGTFGEVMVGTHSLTGEKVAIKVLEKEKIVDVHDVERVAREIHILKVVRHPTIVQLYEIIETSKELYLIMEYARGGELFEYIVSRKRVREKDACKFLHQIMSGVDYLHKLGICHRDLKPENLLMDDHNNIKIVDFGLSNTYKPGETLQTACGSPCYAAPEMVAGKKYDGLAADMWSCGVIIYAMVCGFLPFEDPKTNKLYQKILNAEYQIPDFVSDSCQDLIRKILCTEPTDRLDIEGIRAHPWYQ